MFAVSKLLNLKTPSSPFLHKLTQTPPKYHTRLIHHSPPLHHPNIPTNLHQSINNQTKTSTKILTHLLTNQFHNTNFVFSPIAIHAVLRYIAADSKGKTLHHLLSFLEAKSFNEVDSILSHLTTIFPETNHGPGIGWQICVDQNLSVIKHVSRQDVEDKVYKAGFHKLYHCKGGWLEGFVSLETKECDFTLLNGNKVQVPFMSSKEKQYLREYDGFKVMGFPHYQDQENCKLSMYFFLPNAKDGLQSLIEEIKSTPDFFESHIPDEKVEVGEVLLPRFEIFSEFVASDVLKDLGLVLPFTKDALTEMVDSPSGPNIYVSIIHHKSMVIVNEDQTKVAAGFANVDDGYSPTIKAKMDFVADHPFMFVVKDNVNKFVLFMGQVIDPSIEVENFDCYMR